MAPDPCGQLWWHLLKTVGRCVLYYIVVSVLYSLYVFYKVGTTFTGTWYEYVWSNLINPTFASVQVTVVLVLIILDVFLGIFWVVRKCRYDLHKYSKQRYSRVRQLEDASPTDSE